MVQALTQEHSSLKKRGSHGLSRSLAKVGEDGGGRGGIDLDEDEDEEERAAFEQAVTAVLNRQDIDCSPSPSDRQQRCDTRFRTPVLDAITIHHVRLRSCPVEMHAKGSIA